ncbi:hypothetical protein WSM22_07080 [Cytophagales bacterium WSM2-2]|nr:hypothetical protein WSM22_07080 [Cytophagales bacterium WSM2-2]
MKLLIQNRSASFLKKSLIVSLFAIIYSTADAQFTDGSQWRAITLGLSNPMGKFYQNNLTVPFDQAVGAKPGFYGSLEGANYFKESKTLSVGVSFLVSLGSNPVNWNKWVSGASSYTGKPFLVGELKLGLIVTYQLSDEMKIDGFVRIGDNIGTGGSGEWVTSSGSSTGTTTFSPSKLGLGYGTNMGANFRYKKYIATLQVSTGSMKLKYEYSGGVAPSYQVPITSFHAGIGFVFGEY